MSDWDKIISFSNSKQGGAIQFILLCVILVIMFGSQFRNQMGGGKQRDGKQRDGKQRDGKQRGGDCGDNIIMIIVLILIIALLLFSILGNIGIIPGANHGGAGVN